MPQQIVLRNAGDHLHISEQPLFFAQ